jgi:hypothetical protein
LTMKSAVNCQILTFLPSASVQNSSNSIKRILQLKKCSKSVTNNLNWYYDKIILIEKVTEPDRQKAAVWFGK